MPSPKKIIVCCDGTWQSSITSLDNVPSNVTRLARHLACSSTDAEQQEWNQIVHYDAGVGTSVLELGNVIEGGSGAGLDQNVIEAYNFIVLNYAPGDKVYCFGFSRGAFTARAVAGLVTDIGIVKPRDMQEFPALYRLYQQNSKGDEFRETKYWEHWMMGVKSKNQDPDLRKAHEIPPKGYTDSSPVTLAEAPILWDIRPHDVPEQETRFVEVVGVFDTVGSLGVPDIQGIDLSRLRQKYGFHNVKLSPFVKNAYHALAIDERRGPFTPTLWYVPHQKAQVHTSATFTADKDAFKEQHSQANSDEERLKLFQQYMVARDKETLTPLGNYQRLYQVWFPGMHINIGGGNDDSLKERKGDLEQIANITFCWMAEMLRPHLALDVQAIELFEIERRDALDRVARMHDYGDTWTQSYLNHFLEHFHIRDAPKFKIDPETMLGWATGDIEDSFTGIMRIAGAKTRQPGRCLDDKLKNPDGTHIPLAQLGRTWEFIHPCVEWRTQQLQGKYQSEALNGLQRQNMIREGQHAGWEYYMKGHGWEWDEKQGKVVQADLRIPEWIIYPSAKQYKDRSFERTAMTEQAHSWIKGLDQVYEQHPWWKSFYAAKI